MDANEHREEAEKLLASAHRRLSSTTSSRYEKTLAEQSLIVRMARAETALATAHIAAAKAAAMLDWTPGEVLLSAGKSAVDVAPETP